MNKAELIHCIAARLPEIPRRDVDQSVKLLFDQLSSTLVVGGRCEIRGFGTFSTRTRPARIGRNPKTGKRLSLPKKRALHFKPGKLLKEKVNRNQAKNVTQA